MKNMWMPLLLVALLATCILGQNTTLCASRCTSRGVDGVYYGSCNEHKQVLVNTCYEEEGVYIVTPFYSYILLPYTESSMTCDNSTFLAEVLGACSHPGCCPTIFLSIQEAPIYGYIVDPKAPPKEGVNIVYYFIGAGGGLVIVLALVVGAFLYIRRKRARHGYAPIQAADQ